MFGLHRWSRVNRRAAAPLEQTGVKLDPQARVRDLSFIDRQMVEIWRAVSTDPSVGGAPLIVLDEPTSVLEHKETAVLEREIRNLKAFASVIFVSHRLEAVLRICDRVLVMRGGELILDRGTRHVTKDELFAAMVGRVSQATHQRNVRPADRGRPAVEVRNLTCSGEFRNVSFAAYSGQIVALAGSNVSGSGSLMRAPVRCRNMSVRIDPDRRAAGLALANLARRRSRVRRRAGRTQGPGDDRRPFGCAEHRARAPRRVGDRADRDPASARPRGASLVRPT